MVELPIIIDSGTAASSAILMFELIIPRLILVALSLGDFCTKTPAVSAGTLRALGHW